jgi:ribosome-associated protein
MRHDGYMANSETFPIQIRDESIRLGQLLKLASLADDGFHAKQLIEDGLVKVNGEIETRRGAQIRNGDTVTVNGESVRVETA